MPAILPYRIEYATTELPCVKCRKQIAKDSLQIGIMQQNKYADDLRPEWYDVDCFFRIRRPVSVDFIDGFANLRYAHQMQIQSKLGIDVNQNATTEAGSMNEDGMENVAWTEKQIKFQSNDFFNVLSQLKQSRSGNFKAILKANNQYVPDRLVDILNHLCDIISFGALAPCSVCKDGKLVLQGSVYRCTGYDTPWSSCINAVKEPERVPVQLPDQLREILIVEPVVRVRILRDAINEFKDEDFELYTKQPLFDMEFFIVGDTKLPRHDIERQIQAMGGKMARRIHANLTAVISNAEVVAIGEGIIREAFIQRIQVVSDDFLSEVLDNDPIKVIDRNNMSKYGKSPFERMPEHKPAESQQPFTQDSNKNVPSKSDPNEGGEAYCFEGVRYEAVLNFVDISSNKNTYFKLKMTGTEGKGFEIFESTGRIGTPFGVTKQTSQHNVHQAMVAFKRIYKEKTGNEFGAVDFVKRPGLYNHVPIDNETLNKVSRGPHMSSQPTKLSQPLYELMQLLYSNESVFKSALVEYSFDLDSMPLGKLHKSQIEAALSLLVTISSLQRSESINDIIAASNQFYSIFPHNFGVRRPPIINTPEMIRSKIQWMQHLQRKETRYEYLISDRNKEKNLFDLCYEHLQQSAEITMLNKASGMYAQICAYVENTQPQPPYYRVDEVFEVTRHEEIMRYEPYENNYNRQLLFHGTRIQNFVGILTNGLKISPPEAIFNGSVFGRGIYFSDSLAKSAAYCGHSGYALVLLCEVAAGIIDSRFKKNVSPLIPHCESKQALGQYYPHPLHIRPDGLKIPNGRLIKREEHAGIAYNEFVLEDESRVKIRYLVKLRTGR